MLPNAPGKPNNRVPANLREANRFTFDDVVGLAGACPGSLSPEQVQLLAPLAQRALTAGHILDELLRALRAETARPAEEGAMDRRSAARLLAALGKDAELGPFLPAADQAEQDRDREALNLLSRFHMARYGDEQKGTHLADAWRVTLAALAIRDQDEAAAAAAAEDPDADDDPAAIREREAAAKRWEEEKQKALRRAVELAPKIETELGRTWLVESFTERPERGMEIIATIGGQAARGFETHTRDTAFRLTGLQLQATAVHALLDLAPERAAGWRDSLNLLVVNWLREAQHAYLFSTATALGPIMQRDPYGNLFYISSGRGGPRSPVTPVEPGELLKITPSERWTAMLDASLRPRFSATVAKLYLKVNEEAKAFPFIETLAGTHPDQATELAEEFLRVWTRNNDPNSANRTNPYMFAFGFNQRANGIPLTRSKQERNLTRAGGAGWPSCASCRSKRPRSTGCWS